MNYENNTCETAKTAFFRFCIELEVQENVKLINIDTYGDKL